MAEVPEAEAPVRQDLLTPVVADGQGGPFLREESLLTSHLPVLEVARLLGQLPDRSPSHLVQRRASLCCIDLEVFLAGPRITPGRMGFQVCSQSGRKAKPC